MPDGDFFGPALSQAVLETGEVPMARIDDMVTRILWGMFKAGLFDKRVKNQGDLDAKATRSGEGPEG